MKFAFIIIGMITLMSVSGIVAAEMTHGEMAGIIRSAEHPCTQVLHLEEIDKNSWKVECNSGEYTVQKNAEEQFTVNAINN